MKFTAALLLLALSAQEDPYRQLQDLRESRRAKKDAAEASLRAAHEALDRGEYEQAVERHRAGRRLEAEIVELNKRETALIEAAIGPLVPLLNSERIEERETASARLIVLGAPAVPHLQKALHGRTGEVRARLEDVLALLRTIEVDAEGRVRQWAADAAASSEYSPTSWCAKQATGKPDTPTAGDHATAWASRGPDDGEEWLELSYPHWVRPSRVRVRETFNPGAVSRVEGMAPDGSWRELWKGKDATRECPGWFEIAVPKPEFATRKIRITLDSANVAGWNEIDAVELVGEAAFPPR